MALLKSAMDNMGLTVTGSQLETALLQGAADMGDAGPDNEWGAGLLDVYGAYSWLLANVGDPQAGEVQFSAAAYSIAEDIGDLVITLSRSNGTGGDITIDYSSSDAGATTRALSQNPPEPPFVKGGAREMNEQVFLLIPIRWYSAVSN